ncbi:MAG: hypothetical protein A2W93_00255 [Bacteroidetes bacterium GWF2_43_63]|nr:MAG: hypothetical protein A2W94_13265 [Bacteroidetes bacterium GWE2_42_42]OFY53838.1 MAG: hypothetical protein A2W93_00255 [Bacteroidetes bacterium GWF2_43_63]HBG69794.1 beta-N-acetylhexosaminidase [Bacteroidales bacterium]HCB61008.1 beta-N-acetylhexosaminidase [Bacteroidales bacterium]HCY24564.1 beta-N-acetylhexosaminidase [Bacteroidales bacterium]
MLNCFISAESRYTTVKRWCKDLFAFFLVVGLYFCFSINGAFAQKRIAPALIPSPQKTVWSDEFYKPAKNIRIVIDQPGNELVVKQLQEMIPDIVSVLSDDKNTSRNVVKFKIDSSLFFKTKGIESYSLSVKKNSIEVRAIHPAGFFRAVQTLKQLRSANSEKAFFRCCEIVDWPAFPMRGFMQDVGRNFMSVELLKEQIDVMAAYKYNVFHLHLTDNPGWRLESKLYPELKDSATMSRWPGKYYTQKDFVDLVNYCNDRFITLIPEFDIPGHSEAFRKAFSIDSMRDPRVKPILNNLVSELCALVPVDKMPFIHLGTDEVWNSWEQGSADLLPSLLQTAKLYNRKIVVWRPGQLVSGDSTSITQLWSSNGYPLQGHSFIDSRLNYLNHLDPFAGMTQLYFDRICGAAKGDSMRLGGILCCWNDNLVSDESDILRMNPVYPGMLVYSESAWAGQSANDGEKYLAVLPDPETCVYEAFQNMESRLCIHRDLYFQNKPFPYVRQSHIPWKLIGPFNHGGNTKAAFPVEDSISESYVHEGKTYNWWGPVFGGTIFPKHFFGYPAPVAENEGTIYALTYVYSPIDQELDAWIGFHGWSRSGGRRGGPFPEQGQWHNTNTKIWINGIEIAPPIWNNPGLAANSEEIPFSDEDYFYRAPSKIALKAGWNKVLLKVPFEATSWKWMFTFVPVKLDGINVSEVEGLLFSLKPGL